MLPLLAERAELFRSVVFGEPAGRLAVSELLARCYFDLAGPPNQTQLDALTTIAPIDRLVYGSDYAWTGADAAIRALAGLDKLLRLDKPWGEVTSANAQTLLAAA